jgi:hypothetical protein
MPAPVPATPSGAPGARGSRWPLYAGIAGVLAAVGIVVGIFAKSQPSAAVQTPSLKAEVVAPQAAPEVAAPTAPTSAAPAAPAAKQVMLAAEPIDAHVFRDAEDLGQSPVMIQVEDGQAVNLEIRREGYKPEKVTLDGTKTREIVKLEKIARAGAVYHAPPVKKAEPAPAPAKKPKPAIGGSEIVNPWGN